VKQNLDPEDNSLENSDSPEAPEVEAPSLEKLTQEVNQYKDQSMRLAADLENYRKRMSREKEEAVRYANGSLLTKLLPLLDNFELGLVAARKSGVAGVEEFLVGFEMVERQLISFLEDHGVTSIETIGLPFDPQYHEAVGQEEDPEIPEGEIIRELRRGYQLSGRLLRPSMVVVSKGISKSQEEHKS
jgi:molecular chaperone GrpE